MPRKQKMAASLLDDDAAGAEWGGDDSGDFALNINTSYAKRFEVRRCNVSQFTAAIGFAQSALSYFSSCRGGGTLTF